MNKEKEIGRTSFSMLNPDEWAFCLAYTRSRTMMAPKKMITIFMRLDVRFELHVTHCFFLISSHRELKTGTEEMMILWILKVFMDKVDPTVRSAVAHRSHPGQVFIEAASYEVVHETVCWFDNVKNGVVRALEVEEAQACLLGGSSYTPSTYTWVRIRKGTYRGDIGYVHQVDPRTLHMDIVVVPQVNFDHSSKWKWGGQPPQWHFDTDTVTKRWGAKSLEKQNKLWIFHNEIYTADGYHLWNDVDSKFLNHLFCLPSHSKLEDFNRCNKILIAIYKATSHDIAAKTIHSGDHVLVLDGKCKGLEGNICSSQDGEAKIFIPSQDLFHILCLTELWQEFKISDSVMLTFRPDAGLVAFVLNSLDDVLSLHNQETSMEVRNCFDFPTKTQTG